MLRTRTTAVSRVRTAPVLYEYVFCTMGRTLKEPNGMGRRISKEICEHKRETGECTGRNRRFCEYGKKGE